MLFFRLINIHNLYSVKHNVTEVDKLTSHLPCSVEGKCPICWDTRAAFFLIFARCEFVHARASLRSRMTLVATYRPVSLSCTRRLADRRRVTGALWLETRDERRRARGEPHSQMSVRASPSGGCARPRGCGPIDCSVSLTAAASAALAP